MNNPKLSFLLLIIVAIDLSYSFHQHYQTALDGDLPKVVVPALEYRQVLQDPLGFSVLVDQEKYSAPNRFFLHWAIATYFNHVPLFLQMFTSPVNSVYLSIGLFKTLVQVLLASLLALLISCSNTVFHRSFLLAFALVTPLFISTEPLNRGMGIIDISITYTFSYAAPLALLLLFFYPFFNAYLQDREPELGIAQKWFMPIAAVCLSLSGPLVSPVVILICPILLLRQWMKHLRVSDEPQKGVGQYFDAFRAIGSYTLFLFSFFVLTALYSIFIGLHNSENFLIVKPLSERYALFIQGIYLTFSKYPGVTILFGSILVNVVLLARMDTLQSLGLVKRSLWVLALCGVYLLLLPWGGYRAWRPYIVRYDTFMPVTLSFIYLFGLSTFYIATHVRRKKKIAFVTSVLLILTYFTLQDLSITLPTVNQPYKVMQKPQFWWAYECERKAMDDLAESNEETVALSINCPFLSWKHTREPWREDMNTTLLRRWRVLSPEQTYYRKE